MTVMCDCNKPVVQRTSWTNRNPGRRYIACEKFKQRGGCEKFEFIDPPICERATMIIPGLLKRIGRLEGELEKQKMVSKVLGGALVFSWVFVIFVLVCVMGNT